MLWLGLPFMVWIFLVLSLFFSLWIFKDYRTGIVRGLGRSGGFRVSRDKDAPRYWWGMAQNSSFLVLCLALAVILAFPQTFPQLNAYLAGKKTQATDGAPMVPRPN